MTAKRKNYTKLSYCIASVLMIVVCLTGCRHGNTTDSMLARIQQLLDSDSAYAAASLINESEAQAATFSKAQRMRFQLLKAEAKNKTWVDFTSDSIMTSVVAYYDKTGNPNERMLAHYLLGCVYRDLKETPQAIACYQDAIDCADTLSADCDFKTLSCIYSQMAYLYHHQLALSDAIESRYKSAHYSFLIGDTLNALYDLTQMTGDYMMQGKNDSAEAIFMKARAMYLQHGYKKEWAIVSLPMAHLYLLPPVRLKETKAVLDLYTTTSGQFTSEGTLPYKERMFYRYLGKYYEVIGELDSAEQAYRKMYYPGMRYTHQDAMYHGLLDVFRKKGDVDSIVKYTLLYCQANDSSVATRDRELITQMHASYNYSRVQKEAFRQKARAAKAQNWMTFFIALVILLLLIAIWIVLFFRKRRLLKQQELERTRLELEEAKAAYQKEIDALNLLESAHQQVIELIQGELKSSQVDSELYRAKYEESQHRRMELQRTYEERVKMHQAEIERMKSKIEDLQQKAGVTDSLEAARAFQETDIVRRIQYLAGKSRYELLKAEWDSLMLEFGKSYPALLSDLHQVPTINEKGIYTCILVIIKLRESDIAHFLNVGDTAVSNYKSNINQSLFKDKSARTLFRNLERRYGILS